MDIAALKTEENEHRQGRFAHHWTEQAFRSMNDALEGLDCIYGSSDIVLRPTHPSVFLFGLPRAGCTLAHQVISSNMLIGYVDNVMARFWKNPILGHLVASRQYPFEQRIGDYSNDFGRTTHPRSPHEHSYFWEWVLSLRTEDQLSDFSSAGADLTDAMNILNTLTQLTETPWVHKCYYALNFLDAFIEASDQNLFVFVDRNPKDIALSLYRARMARYGDPLPWFSHRPASYFRVHSMDCEQQIAHQVHDLLECYRARLNWIPKERLLKVRYEDLCESRHQFLLNLKRMIYDASGYEVPWTDIPVGYSMPSSNSPQDGLESKVYRAVTDTGVRRIID